MEIGTEVAQFPEKEYINGIFVAMYCIVRLDLRVCMRSSRVHAWLERLTANAKVATVLGSIPASSDTVESEGRQMKQC
jgi:hypothetical protein